MENKTAIQEIMDIVAMDYDSGVEISMKVFYGMLKNALEKEKVQIKLAFNQGYRNGFNDANYVTENDKDIAEYEDANKYYKENYH